MDAKGDLGLVAEASRSKQTTLFKAPAGATGATLVTVFATYKAIASEKGHSSQDKKVRGLGAEGVGVGGHGFIRVAGRAPVHPHSPAPPHAIGLPHQEAPRLLRGRGGQVHRARPAGQAAHRPRAHHRPLGACARHHHDGAAVRASAGGGGGGRRRCRGRRGLCGGAALLLLLLLLHLLCRCCRTGAGAGAHPLRGGAQGLPSLGLRGARPAGGAPAARPPRRAQALLQRRQREARRGAGARRHRAQAGGCERVWRGLGAGLSIRARPLAWATTPALSLSRRQFHLHPQPPKPLRSSPSCRATTSWCLPSCAAASMARARRAT